MRSLVVGAPPCRPLALRRRASPRPRPDPRRSEPRGHLQVEEERARVPPCAHAGDPPPRVLPPGRSGPGARRRHLERHPRARPEQEVTNLRLPGQWDPARGTARPPADTSCSSCSTAPGGRALYLALSPGGSGLAKRSFALIDHLRSVDKRRVRRVFGQIAAGEMNDVDDGLALFLGLGDKFWSEPTPRVQ